METLNDYLNKYAQWQPDILLCQNMGNGWARRVTYNSPQFVPIEHYNHRNILDNEVVIEFDNEDATLNGKLAGLVAQNCANEGIEFSVWSSGNKSVHVHTFFDMKDVKDLRLMKRLLIRMLCAGVPGQPDYQLAVRRHLIRAEFGLHEKTSRYKTRLIQTENYPKLAQIPPVVWQWYNEQFAARVQQRMTTALDKLDASPMVQTMLDTVTMNKHGDGRERVLFVLIHVLKPRYVGKKEALAEFLDDWYKASGGKKMSTYDIKRKVQDHWDKTYTFTEKYLKEVLEDIGIQGGNQPYK